MGDVLGCLYYRHEKYGNVYRIRGMGPRYDSIYEDFLWNLPKESFSYTYTDFPWSHCAFTKEEDEIKFLEFLRGLGEEAVLDDEQ